MDKLKIGSFFSGIGAFEKALERLEIPHETVFYCEIDKYASKAYSLIHNVPESFNLWDITKVDEAALPDFDLMTWGFPCTDISVAGKQEGFIDDDGNKTRSGLYYDGLRILKAKMPKYSIIENVKNLTSEKFRPIFHQILCDLEDAGYHSYYEVLNAKDYGIPQNRERVFIVSIRKDADWGFMFPRPFDNGLRLKDLLENEVDEKYFFRRKKLNFIPNINTGDIKGFVDVGNYDMANRVYTGESICYTLRAKKNEQLIMINGDFRFLTPLERFRLIGFDDIDFHKCKDGGVSENQLYRVTGNSIVVQVLEGILNNLFLQSGSPDYFFAEQMALF